MSRRCAEFRASLATGGPIRRWQARRHAARCPRCASALAEHRELAELLADVVPLTASQRRLWVSAAGDEIPTRPVSGWWFRAALAGALAALVLIGFGAWWALRPPERRQGAPEIVEVQPPGGISHDLEGLRGQVVALARELDDLSERADLLDARKDVEAIMVQLAPKVGPTGL